MEKIFPSCFTGIQREAQGNPVGTSESGDGHRGDKLPSADTRNHIVKKGIG